MQLSHIRCVAQHLNLTQTDHCGSEKGEVQQDELWLEFQLVPVLSVHFRRLFCDCGSSLRVVCAMKIQTFTDALFWTRILFDVQRDETLRMVLLVSSGITSH